MSNSEGIAEPPASEKVVPVPPAPPSVPAPATHKPRWKLMVAIGVAVVAVLLAIPWMIRLFTTVSTDDAFVNGHVTFVAPRVPGQVSHVWVDDNNRVRKGGLLVQLDPEPYQVQVNIARSAVASADADLVSAQAQTRAIEAATRSLRFSLEHAMEDVDNQVALLRSKAAVLNSERAKLAQAQDDYTRALPLVEKGAITREEMNHRQEAFLVAQAKVEEALEDVYQVRVSLGLPIKPQTGDDLTEVPAELDQTFSTVRQAQASLIQSAAQLGIYVSLEKKPRQMVADFYKRDPEGNIDRIYAKILLEAPAVKAAQAKLAQAQSNLDQANLNLSYCDVRAEIDGVITRRSVNPGNNVIAGQSIMAIRSLTDIWVDANFKETQLADIRIGQPVDLDVDMYGGRHRFRGRVSGFTMGTGSTLALLPAENATGNFVKVVQRLPVRIDLTDYDPDKGPLFIGLSVTPTIHITAEPTGADAGKVLQPYLTPAAPAPSRSPSAPSAPAPAASEPVGIEPATQPETRP